MKVVTAILFSFVIAATKAGNISLPTVNYAATVEDLIKEAQDVSIQTAKLLEAEYKVIVAEPIDQVDIAVQKIEDLREEDVNCVASRDPEVELIVNTLHEEMISCGTVAAKKSAAIMIDINVAMQQLIFDGYKILKLYQKCKNYKNSILKNSCYTKLTIQATLYLKNSRRSIKTIKEANQRVPPIFTEADLCTHDSADGAISELDSIYTQIDSCIKKEI